MKKFLVLGWALLYAFSDVQAARSMWVAMSPATNNWWSSGTSTTFRWECTITNPSPVAQTVTLTPYQAGLFTWGKNTNTALLGAPTTFTLAQRESYTARWESTGTNPNGGNLVPKALNVTVTPDKGFVTGNCINETTLYTGVIPIRLAYTLPINTGLPF